jgi:hypothetical protein
VNLAVAGFPSVWVKTAPCGTEAVARIRTPTFGAAVLAAKLTESCVFAATPRTAPSGGVGATHETTTSVWAGTAELGASTATPAAAIATAKTRRNVRDQEIIIYVPPRPKPRNLILAASPEPCLRAFVS